MIKSHHGRGCCVMKYVPKKILSLIIIGFFLYGMLIQPDFVNDVVNSPLEDKNEKSLGDKTEIPEYSSLMALLNNVDLAEKTALWLYSKSTNVLVS